jgi:hypothetical protein
VQRPERIEHEMFDLEFRRSMIMLDSIMLRCINTGLAAAVNSCAGTDRPLEATTNSIRIDPSGEDPHTVR